MSQPVFGRADLHMHTTASDGVLPVRDLLDHIEKHCRHLTAIAITDHNVLDASLWAYAHKDRYPFDIIPGVEVNTRYGHVLALWVTSPIPKHLDFKDTAAAIHEAGGLAVLAHPFHLELKEVRANAWRYWNSFAGLKTAGLDAIETINAGLVTPGSNRYAMYMAQRAGMAVTGSSDAHTAGAVGSAITRYPGQSAADLRQALLAHETTAEGHQWPLKEYVVFLKHVKGLKAMPSSGTRPSSTPTTPAVSPLSSESQS
ncbi:PHP domain-containing protein [bacterium]|nr:PHP domain-containing protein [bacterium]